MPNLSAYYPGHSSKNIPSILQNKIGAIDKSKIPVQEKIKELISLFKDNEKNMDVANVSYLLNRISAIFKNNKKLINLKNYYENDWVDILNSFIKKLKTGKFRVQNIANALNACMHLKIGTPEQHENLLSILLNLLKDCDAQNIANTLNSCVKLGIGKIEQYERFLADFLKKIHQSNSEEISSLLNSCVHLKIGDKKQRNTLLINFLEMIEYADAQGISIVLNACMHLEIGNTEDHQMLLFYFMKHLEKSELQNISITLNACVDLKIGESELYQKMLLVFLEKIEQSSKQKMQVSIKAIAIMLDVFMNLNIGTYEQKKYLLLIFLKQIELASIHEVLNALNICLGLKKYDDKNEEHYENLISVLLKKIAYGNALDISHVLNNFVHLRIGNKEIYEIVLNRFLKVLDESDVRGISNVLSACVNLEIGNYEQYRNLFFAFLNKLEDTVYKDISQVLNAYVKLSLGNDFVESSHIEDILKRFEAVLSVEKVTKFEDICRGIWAVCFIEPHSLENKFKSSFDKLCQLYLTDENYEWDTHIKLWQMWQISKLYKLQIDFSEDLISKVETNLKHGSLNEHPYIKSKYDKLFSDKILSLLPEDYEVENHTLVGIFEIDAKITTPSNLIIDVEFDGELHYVKNKLRLKDRIRDAILENNFQCPVIRVRTEELLETPTFDFNKIADQIKALESENVAKHQTVEKQKPEALQTESSPFVAQSEINLAKKKKKKRKKSKSAKEKSEKEECIEILTSSSTATTETTSSQASSVSGYWYEITNSLTSYVVSMLPTTVTEPLVRFSSLWKMEKKEETVSSTNSSEEARASKVACEEENDLPAEMPTKPLAKS